MKMDRPYLAYASELMNQAIGSLFNYYDDIDSLKRAIHMICVLDPDFCQAFLSCKICEFSLDVQLKYKKKNSFVN